MSCQAVSSESFVENPARVDHTQHDGMGDKHAVIAEGWSKINFVAKPTASEQANDDLGSRDNRISTQGEFRSVLCSDPEACRLAHSLACAIGKIFPESSILVRLLNERSGELDLVSSVNGGENASMTANQGVGAADVLQGPNRSAFHSNSEMSDDAGLHPSLVIALSGEVKTLGVVEISRSACRAFKQDDIELATTLATQAASAIEKSELLCQTRLELRRSERIKSDFLSRMSHEFKTPLTLINGYAEMIRDGFLGAVTEEQGKGLNEILRASDQLTGLVREVLEAGDIESGTIQIRSEILHLSRFLDERKSELRLPQDKQLELIWAYPADLPVMWTDAKKLKYVLHQLIDNAIKFTRRGRVIVSSQRCGRSKVEIKVTDTGVGIPSQIIPTLFGKFQQMDGSMTRSHNGAGLGLYLAQQWCRFLGAELSVTSEVGVGSIFTVVLPLAD